MAPKARESTSKIPVDEEDDDRTQASKQITWVLRRGAAGVGIDIDDKGWVKVEDLAKYGKLAGLTVQELLQVIDQSNTKKARYQVSPDRTFVRAFGKEERKTINDQYTDPQAAAAVAQMGAGYPGYWSQMQHPMMPYMNPFMGMGWQQAAAAMSAAGNPAMHEGRKTGYIKSFNPEKGFGFIECAETMAIFGRDVFAHKAQVGNLTQGHWVTFVCEVGKNGMPQATFIQTCQYPGYAAEGMGGKGGKGGKGNGGKGKGEDGDKGKGKGKGKGKQDKDSKDKKEETKDSEDKSDEKKSEDEAAKATAEVPKA